MKQISKLMRFLFPWISFKCVQHLVRSILLCHSRLLWRIDLIHSISSCPGRQTVGVIPIQPSIPKRSKSAPIFGSNLTRFYSMLFKLTVKLISLVQFRVNTQTHISRSNCSSNKCKLVSVTIGMRTYDATF